jgi:hypothetical protein
MIDFFSETKVAGCLRIVYHVKRGFFNIKEKTFKISWKKGMRKMKKLYFFYTAL